jgi:hypothetical protein
MYIVYMELLSRHEKIITKSGISLNAGTWNWGFTVLNTKLQMTIFGVTTPCRILVYADVSDGHAASIFRVSELVQVIRRRRCVNYICRSHRLWPIRGDKSCTKWKENGSSERDNQSNSHTPNSFTPKMQAAHSLEHENKLIILHGVITLKTSIWQAPAMKAWTYNIKLN